MLNRRRTLQTGLATLLSAAAPLRAFAQSKPRVKVRYSEVVHSMLVRAGLCGDRQGLLRRAGLDVTLTTAQGGDKSLAIMLSNQADIGLIGPETAIYVQNSDSPVKIPIFCGLTATDGFMLVGREKVDKFDWSMLKGKEILGFRPGSTPLLFLEAALRQNGLDPQKDVKLMNNVGIPARVGSWLAGPEPIRDLHRAGRGAARARRQGAFPGLDRRDRGSCRLHDLHGDGQIHPREQRDAPELDQRDRQGMKWTAEAPIPELVKTLEQFFPGVNPKAMAAAAERYRRLKIWKTSPVIEPAADGEVPGHSGAGPRARAGASA